MLAKSGLERSIELLFELYVCLCIFLKLMHQQLKEINQSCHDIRESDKGIFPT
jgi:hypothetical protein